MKFLTLVLTIMLGSGIPDKAPAQSLVTEGAGDTVGALNQVTPETRDDGTKMKPREEQQDAQERMYWENQKREEEEWQRDKQIDDYRFDVPGP